MDFCTPPNPVHQNQAWAQIFHCRKAFCNILRDTQVLFLLQGISSAFIPQCETPDHRGWEHHSLHFVVNLTPGTKLLLTMSWRPVELGHVIIMLSSPGASLCCRLGDLLVAIYCHFGNLDLYQPLAFFEHQVSSDGIENITNIDFSIGEEIITR